MRVETGYATAQIDANIVEEATDQATAINEPQAADDTDQLIGTGDPLPAVDTSSDDAETEETKNIQPPARRRGRIKWSRVVAFGLLPLLALLLAAAAAFAKWQDSYARASVVAGIESVTAAKESTVALVSYQPDTVEKDLGAAGDRLTGTFKDSYTQFIRDVVIPGAKKDHISAIATVPAAASVTATQNHAVVLVLVDQTVTIGTDAPTATASSVRVTLDKIHNRWLISHFDPI